MKTSSSLFQMVVPAFVALGLGCDGNVSKGDGVTVFLEPLAESDLALAPGGAGLVSGASLAEAVNSESRSVGTNWRLDSNSVHEVPPPYIAKGKQYWLEAGPFALMEGIPLRLSAPGAVVTLSPKAATPGAFPKALQIEDLLLKDASGVSYQGVDAVELGVTTDELQPGDLPFLPGTTIFKMRPELGAGTVELRVGDAARLPEGNVLITVLEPKSDIALTLQSKSDVYLKGQTASFTARWEGSVIPQGSVIQGELRSPTGKKLPVELVANPDGSFTGGLTLNEEVAKPGALWELTIHAQAQGPQGMTTRSVKTAFAYSLGTAAFEPTANLPTWPSLEPLRIRFGLNVGSAGRYAVTGVLYGTSESGEMVPFMVSQAAVTVEAGKQEIELVFENALENSQGLRAPFEIRDLRLLDQTRLGLLHRQARGLVLPN